MPLFGQLLYKVAMTRVTRTLRDPHLRGRAHARGLEDHVDDGRERHHRGRDRRGPQARLRRQDDERVVQAGRALPDDDAPDDQRRRGHGHTRRDADEAGRISTTRRSTPPYPPSSRSWSPSCSSSSAASSAAWSSPCTCRSSPSCRSSKVSGRSPTTVNSAPRKRVE